VPGTSPIFAGRASRDIKLHLEGIHSVTDVRSQAVEMFSNLFAVCIFSLYNKHNNNTYLCYREWLLVVFSYTMTYPWSKPEGLEVGLLLPVQAEM